MRQRLRGFRVAIIGGGTGAVDLAYPLRQHNIPVDIFEQQPDMATQSARRSAGQLSYDDGGPVTDATKAVLAYWEKESGLSPFLDECPTAHLTLKGGPDDSYRHVLRHGLRPGLTALSAAEAAGLWGAGNLRASRIDRAILDERDYRLNPMAMVNALRRSNEFCGELYVNTQVTSIDRGGDGEWRVELKFLGKPSQYRDRDRTATRGGPYSHVINAAGAYANEIAILAGQVAPSVRPTMGTSFRAGLPEGRSIDPAGPMLVWDTEELSGCYLMPMGSAELFGSPSEKRFCQPQTPYPSVRTLGVQLASVEDLTGIEAGAYRGMSVVGCMRTLGPGGTPVLGIDDSGWGNLNGLGSHGVQLGPAIGEYLASRITGVAPPPEIAEALREHLPWLESCSPEVQRLPGPEVTHPHGRFQYPYTERGIDVKAGSEQSYLLAPLHSPSAPARDGDSGYVFSPGTNTWLPKSPDSGSAWVPPLPRRTGGFRSRR